MKKRLFNIHKVIGVNILLFFFLSLFFGILTIFQPYVNLWEDSKQHIKQIKIQDINFEQCLKQITKRTYINEKGEKVRNDVLTLDLPSKEKSASKLIRVRNRPNFYLDPNTCKRVRPKNFRISKFFDNIHTGAIFKSIYFKIIYGFMSVAVVFLCLSGLLLLIKNKYSNKKTTSPKTLYAKYHRLLFLYTLPLIFMFGLTGALFNLGVYSSPLLTHYLSDGKTINVLKVKRNILFDPVLENINTSKKIPSLNLNVLYKKAQKEFIDITFYQMQIYNYNDINARVKFVGYEPNNFFISSTVNESYIVLDGKDGSVLAKKYAKDGSFAEKTLDAIFYLHYLRTFSDLPRIIFAFLCSFILIGLVFAMTLYLERAKKETLSFKILRPLSFTIILGSILSASVLFSSAWLLPKAYMFFDFFDKRLSSQELLFYFTFIFTFILIYAQKNLFKSTKYIFNASGFFLLLAVFAHDFLSNIALLTCIRKRWGE